jgi:PAS domain S-box-containing protein
MIARSTRRYRFEWILLGTALLILGALIGFWLHADRVHIETVERDRLQVQARVIDENLSRQLGGVNNALAEIRNDFPLWRDRKRAPAASHQLKVLSAVMPGVRTMLILDAAGSVLAASRDELTGLNFSEREYFKVPRERPDPTVLYVSPPFRTTLNVFAINVVRAVIGSSGEFAGIVSATLDPEYFNVLLRSVLYAPDMRAVLVHWDGRAFLFMPPNERMVGIDLAKPGSFFSRHRDSGEDATLLTSTSIVSGEERLMASRSFRRAGAHMDKPLVIHVSRELAAIYLPWRTQALGYGVFYAVIALAAVLGLHLLQRRRRRLDLAAAEQEKAERLLLHFFDLPFVGMAITSPKTKHWLQFNDRLCAMLGYPREELARKTWAELTHPEDLAKDVAEFERVLRGESEGYGMDKRFIRKDGAVVFTTIDIKCTRNVDRSVEYIVAMVQDVTERKRKEDEYRTVIQTSTDGFWVTDTAGRILDVNESICQMLGYSREELLRMAIRDIDADESPEEVDARTREMMQAGSARFQARHRRKDGSVIDVEVNVLYVEGLGERLFAFVRDITARKRTEAERLQLEAQLRESQKMEALGTLAGGVAHDFNNIVATIMGNVELALEDVGPGHAAQESLEEIRKASRRAKNLVQQILAFGRRQVLERQVISLEPTVAESARMLRATLPAGVSLHVECAADAPLVLADAMQIQQVLLNLCANAWQAMQGQERPAAIEVRLAPHTANGTPYAGPQQRSRSGRVALRPGSYACLMVRDTGPGMDQATRSRIFEPFFTTKSVGKGTGLGLAVVHGIVQDHGASIAVQSAPGEGATFRIYFPAAKQAAEQVRDARPAPGAARGQDGGLLVLQGEGKSILYLDDDEAIVFLMTRLLDRQGYHVSGHTDPQAALEAVRAQPNAYDLVVTDYNMPGLSGLEVARALREIRADLPVALASGYITEELRAQAPAAGVSELIYKPNTVDELFTVVARLANTLRV